MSLATTRVASAEFGWTCSQPLDLLDGYDLLSKSGIQMLWDVLRQHRPVLILIAFDCRIWSLLTNCNPGTDWELLRSTLGKKTLDLIAQLCIWQDQHGAYYVLENPAGSLAWVYEGILARLLVEANGKYATGDQCCFGKKDADTGKPVRKATGWLCNSEHILNRIAKRCRCPFGSHQNVVGSNSLGLRSKQAAMYPRALCRAICQGLLDTMVFDYSWKVPNFEAAFPTFEEQSEEVSSGYEPSIAEEDETTDQWFIDDDGALVRSHVVPRNKLFVPRQADPNLPVEYSSIMPIRHTILQHQDGTVQNHTDDWTIRQEEVTNLYWTGQTRFTLDHTPVMDEQQLVGADGPEGDAAEPREQAKPKAAGKKPDKTLRRRRVRTRQLQRGFWREEREEEPFSLL